MFTCRTCARRAIQRLATDLHNSETNPSSILSAGHAAFTEPWRHTSALNKPFRTHERGHATLASLAKPHHRKPAAKLRTRKGQSAALLGNKRRAAPAAFTKAEIRDADARDKNRAALEANEKDTDDADEDDLIRPSQLDEPSKSEMRDLKKERADAAGVKREEMKLLRRDQRDVATYLMDPLQLADAVVKRLRVANIKGALRLVHASEALRVANIVSWNHCIDWLMAQGSIKDALKVYNDLKKRGHRPDAHTYTIMLRGFSQNAHKASAVDEAIKVYNSIFAPNSAVKPSVIHTNAIINVCARGGRMDSLWAIAGRLPEKGPGSPDRLTYTLILNAIRETTIKAAAQALDPTKNKGDMDAAADARNAVFQNAIDDARKLWEDISFRWRRADLVIDEQLVCAMGRLLVGCSVGRDIEQVFDLVQTTMNLPKPAGMPGTRAVIEEPSQKDGWEEVEAPENLKTTNLPIKDSNVYATPGQKTLSLLLEACMLHKISRPFAKVYWQLLTDPDGKYKIRPDTPNIMQYLRILRTQRASAQVLDLLTQTWPSEVAEKLFTRGTFIVAFATCSRDKNNPNVFGTAQKLLELMHEKLEAKTMAAFDQDAALQEMTFPQRKAALMKQRAEARKQSSVEIADQEREAAYSKLNDDPKIIQYFIQLGVDTTSGWNEGLRGKDDGQVFERDPRKNNAMVALAAMLPQLPNVNKLIKNKLASLEQAHLRKVNDRKQVDKEIDELLLVIRTTIGACDKVVEAAQRFKQQGRAEIPANFVDELNSRKREFTGYMGRVEKAIGRKVKAAKSTDEEDVEEQKPQFEKQISTIMKTVDSYLVGDVKSSRRPRRVLESTRSADERGQVRLKILGNRKLAARRSTKLNTEFERQFSDSDSSSSVLDENLKIVTDESEKAAMYDRMARRNIAPQSSPRDSGRHSNQSEKVSWQPAGSQGTQSSILGHAEVQRAWSTHS